MVEPNVFDITPRGRWQQEVLDDGTTVVLSCMFEDLGLFLKLEERGGVYNVGLYAGSASGVRLEPPTTHETAAEAREQAEAYLAENPKKYYNQYAEQRDSLDAIQD